MPQAKQYDRAYFNKWYHDRRHAVRTRSDLQRETAFAIAITEQFLARRLGSVLDVGAGEGRWQPMIHKARPSARYAGVDSSPWAIRTWGKRRNLRLGSFATLDQLGLDGPFDLVVAADVLHYVPSRELEASLAALVPFIGGVAFLPTFAAEDEIEGDQHQFQRRRAVTYRRLFSEAGLVPLGMHAWTTRALSGDLAELEGMP